MLCLTPQAQSAIVGYLIVGVEVGLACSLEFSGFLNLHFVHQFSVFYDWQQAPYYYLLFPPLAFCWGLFVLGHAVESAIVTFYPWDAAVNQALQVVLFQIGMGFVFLVLAKYLKY